VSNSNRKVLVTFGFFRECSVTDTMGRPFSSRVKDAAGAVLRSSAPTGDGVRMKVNAMGRSSFFMETSLSGIDPH
jgi:hypothetical protein